MQQLLQCEPEARTWPELRAELLRRYMPALAADFASSSHKYLSNYLINPVSVVATHIPACACQWTREEASRNFTNIAGQVRSD